MIPKVFIAFPLDGYRVFFYFEAVELVSGIYEALKNQTEEPYLPELSLTPLRGSACEGPLLVLPRTYGTFAGNSAQMGEGNGLASWEQLLTK